MKTDSCNQSQCVNRTLQFVRKNKRASKIQLTLSQFVFLTARQQLLLHACDWLGLKRLRINTPCVPYRDVSLLHPAMHPQYVTITQQILSLKFSVAYKMQCRGYSEWIKSHFCFMLALPFGWQAHSCSLLPCYGTYCTIRRLVMVSSPLRWRQMPDPSSLPHWFGQWLQFQSTLVREQNLFLIYVTNSWSPGYWNTTSPSFVSIKLLPFHQVCGTNTGSWSLPQLFQHHCHVLGLNTCKLC